MKRGRRVVNFGGNVAFVPARIERPRDAGEVLDALRRHPGARFRCVGARHSWSPVIATDGVLLDLRHLKHVDVDFQRTFVRVGAGCTLRRLLRRLRREDLTLPTLGAITAQTIAGAISTGTHGSGSPSLSDCIAELRVATFAPQTGEPVIVTFRDGAELRAARCALGSLGVIVELVLRVRPRYRVEERVQKTRSLDKVLAGRDAWPLQQFALLPWSWMYLVFRRRETQLRGSRVRAWLCRTWNFLATDIGLHLVLKGLLLWAKVFGERSIRAFYKGLPGAIVAGPARIDDSQAILTLHHDCFRHVEMELFVPESRLQEAVGAIQEIVRAAGEGADSLETLEALDLDPDLLAEVRRLRGAYTLHYPLFFRRVQPDDTLVSMTSEAAEPVTAWYSVSFFTYRRPRDDFARFAGAVARCMIALFGARVHWGKYFPIPLEHAARSYPRYAEFAAICRKYDPKQQFWY